jgi:hypothetical protein
MITPLHSAALLAQLAAYPQVVVSVKLTGKTDGETEIESGEFLWPIYLINASLRRADNECIVIEELCGSQIGQNEFARACVGT